MPQVTYGPAEAGEISRLQEIFLLCFGEEAAAEMNYIFERYCHALWSAKVNEIPAAMLVAMPVAVALPGGEYPARYFYGVATHPEARRQGLCSGLLEACGRWMAQQGETMVLLRPDSEKNRRFYAKQGFTDCSAVGKGSFFASDGTALPGTPAEPEQYDALRRKFAPWGLQWGQEGLAIQKGWLRLYGGDLWLLGLPEKPLGCAAVSREGEIPLVRELLCEKSEAVLALEGLCKVLECRELHLALPDPAPVQCREAAPMMMVKKVRDIDLPGTIYTPLAMD